MTTIREAIRESNRLARMRQGQLVGEPAEIPSMPEVRPLLVPLTEAESQAGMVAAAALDVADNAAGLQARNRAALQSDVWHALREPGNLQARVFESIEVMVEELTADDIDHLADQLTILSSYASPAVDGVDEQVLADLKEGFVATNWNALTGRQWAALKLAILAIYPNVLLDRSLGTTSTESATSMKESAAST